MAKLIECIPNFSEGRRSEVIEALVSEAQSVPGVILLDHSSDESHNRSVFTMVGSPEGIGEAAFRLAKKAAETIDLTKHTGEHPRMGAVDVVPFVPIQDVTMEDCITLSKQVAERVNSELGIPVFLYEESASAPERKNLAAIRKGQFEGMPEKLKDPKWQPDYGKAEIHPTAGVVAIGARAPLVAFNINLSTSDIQIANNIAKIIRESSGGLKYVKSIGVMLEDRNIAQVSINMCNYVKTPLYRVFELVRAEAARYGVQIIGSEIIGLTPMNALVDSAEYYLKLENFDSKVQVLENHLL
ncbi:glutamate formimidoyltransferase [Feifania hominis]|uniref:glutamate formimidoyltransferase n=1 Tax=Feifania hominis TaxID=2763660 RepID=A0A926HTI8_9FIRM|nr:glutamate formimidoyltransferase [Feifania hominis]MBC8535353.1 glutamate formimidoyltransferase [Feifania hominis]